MVKIIKPDTNFSEDTPTSTQKVQHKTFWVHLQIEGIFTNNVLTDFRVNKFFVTEPKEGKETKKEEKKRELKLDNVMSGVKEL